MDCFQPIPTQFHKRQIKNMFIVNFEEIKGVIRSVNRRKIQCNSQNGH